MTTGFPVPRDDDSEDIVWGLTTGAALWKQGARDDALVWLKRAIDAATEAGAHDRAAELSSDAVAVRQALAAPSPLRAPTTPNKARPAPPPPARAAKAPPAPARPVDRPPPPRTFAPIARSDTSQVTTSAPPLETLTQQATIARAVRDSPPPPTIVPAPVASPGAFSSPSEDATTDPNNADAGKRASSATSAGKLAALLDRMPDLSDEQRAGLAESAVLEPLADEEEVRVSGLVLLVSGEASVGAAVTDLGAKRLTVGEPVLARGSIADALALRVVADTDAVVATWDQEATNQWLGEGSDLLERWQRASDRVQAIAGSTIGPIGDRLDPALQSILFERLDVRAFQPGATVAHAGRPVPGIVIVGVGTIELERDGTTHEKLGPGDFLFATEILGQAPAPASARAGAKGAVVLLGSRATTYDVLMSCPPLLEIFSGG